ncbi:unnamed protein product [Symbiodinium necroappetens]|uniref:Protein kinase domain-containing protein n=1 Tax=Symbiodinium necroappetens TaxID=1628268 RepID=A0A812YU24_9DINO|nr:unnamed protein product [Symbiodinium necroappetens]
MTYKQSLLSVLNHPFLATPLCQCAAGSTIVRQCAGCRPLTKTFLLDLQTSAKAKIRFLVFAIKVAEALAYLHHSPIGPVLHNDLIDRNVLVNFDTGALMLIDFDMAIVLPNMGARVREEKGTSSPNLDRYLDGPVLGAANLCVPSRAVLKMDDFYATYNWRTTHEDLECYGIAVERDLFSLGQLFLTLLGTQPLPVRWRSSNISFQLFEDSYIKPRRRARWSFPALSAMTGFKRILHNQFSSGGHSLAGLLLGLLGPLPRPSASELAKSLRQLLQSLFPHSLSLLDFKQKYRRRLTAENLQRAASTTYLRYVDSCAPALMRVPRQISQTLQFLPVLVEVPGDKQAASGPPTGERYVKLVLRLPRGTAECDVIVYRGRGSCSFDLRGRQNRFRGLASLSVLSPTVCFATVHINLTERAEIYQGAISEEFSLWGPGVVRVTSDVHVLSGATLHIVPGTVVQLAEAVSIFVEGALRSVGRAEDPVLFSADKGAASWGSIRCTGGTVLLQHTVVSQGGVTGNLEYLHGHSNSEPVLYAERGILSVASSAIIDCLGKAAGSRESLVFMSDSLISRVDTGGEHFDSLVTFRFMHVLELPGASRELGEDDNDGLYLNVRPENIEEGPWWASLPDRSFGALHGSLGANSWPVSLIESSVFIRGNDDAIDFCGGFVEIRDVEIRRWHHEGLALSSPLWLARSRISHPKLLHSQVLVVNAYIEGCEQGLEVGFGDVAVEIRNSTFTLNSVGLRRGDSYSVPKRVYRGTWKASGLRLLHNFEYNLLDWVNGQGAGALFLEQEVLNSEMGKPCLPCPSRLASTSPSSKTSSVLPSLPSAKFWAQATGLKIASLDSWRVALQAPASATSAKPFLHARWEGQAKRLEPWHGLACGLAMTLQLDSDAGNKVYWKAMHSQNRDFNDESFWPEILVFALDVALGVWTSLPAVGRTMSVDEVMQRFRDVCEQCSLHSMKLGCVSRLSRIFPQIEVDGAAVAWSDRVRPLLRSHADEGWFLLTEGPVRFLNFYDYAVFSYLCRCGKSTHSHFYADLDQGQGWLVMMDNDRCFQLEGESALDTVSEDFEKMRLDQFRQIIETCDWVGGLSKHLLQQLSDVSHPMSVRMLDALRGDLVIGSPGRVAIPLLPVLEELDRRALYLAKRISQCQLNPQPLPRWSPFGFARQGLAACWAPTWVLNWDTCCDARHGPLGNRSCWKPPRSFERCCMRARLTQAD